MKRSILLIVILCTLSLAAADGAAAKAPRLMTGLHLNVGDGEAAAARWLTREFLPAHFRGTATVPTLARHIRSAGIDIYRYDHRVNGVPVIDAATALAVKDGILYRVTNSAGMIPASFDTRATVAAGTAARVAFASLAGAMPSFTPRHWAEKRIVRHNGSWRLAWKERSQRGQGARTIVEE